MSSRLIRSWKVANLKRFLPTLAWPGRTFSALTLRFDTPPFGIVERCSGRYARQPSLLRHGHLALPQLERRRSCLDLSKPDRSVWIYCSTLQCDLQGTNYGFIMYTQGSTCSKL